MGFCPPFAAVKRGKEMKTVVIKIPDELDQKLIEHAKSQNVSLENLILESLIRLVDSSKVKGCEGDRSQRVEFEVADGVIAYLKPDSAEAKALERIAAPITEGEWIVADDVGQEIDMDAVREKFKQRGYKSKISGTKASASGKSGSTKPAS